MKDIYIHKGFTITRTETRLASNNRPLFEISCDNGIFRNYIKEAGKRPWITSIKEAKQFVNNYIEYQTMF